MKKLILLAAAAVVAFFTNPSSGRHQEAFDQEFRRDHPVMGFLGGGLVASHMLTYHGYGVFSTSEFGHRTMSVGAFGIVHVRTAAIANMADELLKS
ncbi:MAG: hypothetical protein JWM27_2260 [Gemmatimonadetes bacterium]|nr:hypothetical protein [Gemmatimonadota bacterium]